MSRLQLSNVVLILFATCCLLLRCSPTALDGTGNALISGTLYQPDGKTPAAGVMVAIRPKKALADTSSKLSVIAVTARGTRADTATVKTDENGRFAFDTTLDTGTYIIEAASGNNAALIDLVKVTKSSGTDTLPPDTLKPAGAIKGVIKLSEGGDPRKVFVLAFGIDRLAKVNIDGSFKFSNLAEATYDLRLISSLDDYGVLDTAGISVKSSDTTALDTVCMPFNGIPTPKNVRVEYDTMRQIVKLRWNQSDTSLVNGYNVYRRNVDSNTVLTRINTSPVTNSVYHDSTVIQDLSYEYKVTALDKQGNEGKMGDGVMVKAVGAFIFMNNFGQNGLGTGQFITPVGVAVDREDHYWVIDHNRATIMKFDSSGNFLYEWGDPGNDPSKFIGPGGIGIDPNGNVIVSEAGGTKVKKFDTSGNLLLKIDSNGIAIKNVGVDEHGGIYLSFVIYASGSNCISKYDSTGKFIRSWKTMFKTLHSGLFVKNGKVYCAGVDGTGPNDDNVVRIFDTLGTPLDTVHIRRLGETGVIVIVGLCLDEKGWLYVSNPEDGKIRVYDETMKYVCYFGKKGNDPKQCSWIQGIAIRKKIIAVTDYGLVHLFKIP